MAEPNYSNTKPEGLDLYGALSELQNKNRVHSQAGGQPMKALVQTFGCQQNENDSEHIAGLLSEAGFLLTDDRSQADIIIFNTCAVREHAESRVFGNIGALKPLKAQNPNLLIGICGCMPQQPHIVEEILKKYRHVDFIFGTHTIDRLPWILLEAMERKGPAVVVAQDNESIPELPIRRKNRHKAFVSVMSGCNNFCSYCIVPYTRGREKSRNPQDIIAEIKGLVDDGCKEIMLLGQNVNAYGRDLEGKWGFPRLLRELNSLEGDFWIRFMTSHPKDLTDELIETIAECKKVERHLHLPVQAGSDRILRLMNRRYTASQYLKIISDMRAREPEMSFSSDIIVGFPTETEEEFEETLKLVESARYLNLFTFIYSPRKGTPAAKMEGQLQREIKIRRFERLIALQNSISSELHAAMVGKTIKVLTEGQAVDRPGKIAARSSQNHLVFFDGKQPVEGKFVQVTITSANPWSLDGVILN